jgi:imidazolonepropionase-like amidohydrolase
MQMRSWIGALLVLTLLAAVPGAQAQTKRAGACAESRVETKRAGGVGSGAQHLPPGGLRRSRVETLAIRNARLYTVSGGVVEGGTLLIQNGKIRAVGANVTIPAGTFVIDGTGKVVTPGLIDANAHFGLRDTSNEQAFEVTPQVRVSRLIDPHSPDFKRALQSGITSACITPGTANVIGGLCAVVKTTGRDLSRMLLREDVAERAALGYDTVGNNSSFRFFGSGSGLTNMYLRRPNSRMGAVWEMRKALSEARKSPALTRVRAGGLPLRINARVENDIRAALTIAEEFQVPHLILDECTEGYKVADRLAARHIPVVLGPFVDPHDNTPEDANPALNTAGILADRGVQIAFGSNDQDATQLRMWGAFAVRYGLKPEIALRALTLTAAEIAGVADRIGSLDVGKDGDVLVLSGDPLEVTTRIEKVIVNGQVVHSAE